MENSHQKIKLSDIFLIDKNKTPRQNLNILKKSLGDDIHHVIDCDLTLEEIVFCLYFDYHDIFCIKGRKKAFINLKKGFSRFCGKNCECFNSHLSNIKKQQYLNFKESILQKRKQTWTLKYGVDNPLKAEIVRQKIKQTNFEKYGVDNPVKNIAIKCKIKQTNLKKYGSESVLSCDSLLRNQINKKLKDNAAHRLKKIKQTVFDRYGVNNIFQFQEIKDKKRLTFQKNYNETHHMKSDFGYEKYLQSLKRIYGDYINNPKQLHLSKESLEILSDKNKFLYIAQNKSLSEIATCLGISKTYAGKKVIEFGLQNTVNYFPNISEIHQEILDFLKIHLDKNELILVNDRKAISPLELDIFIPSKKLAIEICGLFWHSENAGNKTRFYHYQKYYQCINKNINLITVFSDDWIYSKKFVENILLLHLNSCNNTNKILNQNNFDFCEIKDQKLLYNFQNQYCYINTVHKTNILNFGIFDQNNDLLLLLCFEQYNLKNSFSIVNFGFKFYLDNIKQMVLVLINEFIKQYDVKNLIFKSNNCFNDIVLFENFNFNHVFCGFSEPNLCFDYTFREIFNTKNTDHLPIKSNSVLDIIYDCGFDLWVWNNINDVSN